MAGCSPQAKDKLLRTFFDGVPALNQTQAIPPGKKEEPEQGSRTPQGPEPLQPAPSGSIHPPFLDNQCDSCHESKFSQALAAKGKDLCFACHDDFSKNKKTVHAPVSEGLCTDCHDPHQSINKRLLKKPIPEICFTCHDEKEVKAMAVHEAQAVCLECHNPHASNEEKLLK